MNLGIEHILEQKHTVRAARPARYTVLRTTAEALSRRTVATAHCEVLNEALHALTRLCYEIDPAYGGYCNIDGKTGRILIPMPCGCKGRYKWGVRRIEADALRLILFAYMDNPKIAPLYVYDAVSRGWYVNLFDYPNKTHAQNWVRRCQVTPDTWIQAVERMRGEP